MRLTSEWTQAAKRLPARWETVRDVALWVGRNSKRVAIAMVGFALVAAGLVMLVLPGPGILVIIAGLAVLATEFAWAKRALDMAKDRAQHAKDKGTSLLRRRKSA